MLIGDSRVSHIVVRRREFTRCALKEEARRGARVGFDHVPHRADEVRGDELVVPRERGGVAGVVHKRGEDGAIGIAGYTADDDSVVRRLVRVVTTDDPLAGLVGVGQVAVGGEIAAARGPGECCTLCGHQGFAGGFADRFTKVLLVGGQQVAAGQVRSAQRGPGRRVGVRAVHHDVSAVDAQRFEHGLHDELFVGPASQITQQGEVDADDHQGHFALVALDDQRGGGDGFVRALGAVALCRAPHAGVDAHGGSDVASRNADKGRGGGRDDFKLLFCLGQWHEWCIPCDAESVWSMARRFQAERGFCRRTCASFN